MQIVPGFCEFYLCKLLVLVSVLIKLSSKPRRKVDLSAEIYSQFSKPSSIVIRAFQFIVYCLTELTGTKCVFPSPPSEGKRTLHQELGWSLKRFPLRFLIILL